MFPIQTQATAEQLHSKKKSIKCRYLRERTEITPCCPLIVHQRCVLGRRAKSVLLSALVSLEKALKHGSGVRGPGLLVLDGFL